MIKAITGHQTGPRLEGGQRKGPTGVRVYFIFMLIWHRDGACVWMEGGKGRGGVEP